MARRRKPLKLKLRSETINSIVVVILIMLGLLIMVSFSGQGKILSFINQLLILKLGISMFFLPFIFISSGMVMLRTKWAWSKPHILLGTILLMLATMGMFKAGEIGEKVFYNFSLLLTSAGSYVAFFSLAIVGILVIGQWSLAEILEFIANKAKLKNEKNEDKKDKSYLGEGPSQEDINRARAFNISKLSFGNFGKKKDFSVNDKSETTQENIDPSSKAVEENKKTVTKNNIEGINLLESDGITPSNVPIVWEYPPLSLLSNAANGKADRGDVRKNAQIIEGTLDSFGIKAHVAEVNYGPSVTQYALEITQGTKLSKITGLSTDLALALAAPTGTVRIEAPIVGRSLVGVEVPNYSAQYVTLRTMLSSDLMKKNPSKLAVALGISVSGKPVVADIAKMPHVLIAGATGSGKSVAINAFMCSILFRASPEEVKFILVDPKRVELTGYNNIPHLLTPVIVEPAKVVSALKWATNLMDKRYKQLAEVGVKNISDYNELAGLVAMPNIVIVIDELADIMLFSPKEVEDSVTRIAQMARAVGIHLVLATQRPSVDVITGLIKANVPTRIAFNVSSMMDSRVILDSPGAEKLLGRGDMLYVPPDQAKPSRVQGTYVADSEIKQLIDFLKSQGKGPDYKEEITTKYTSDTLTGGSGGLGGGTGTDDRDPLFVESAKLFANYDKASSSLIQRRLSVGYARAARILDQLYEAGMVSEPDGSKPREVNNAKIQEYLAGLKE